MTEKYQHRDDAPFDAKLWELIDETVVSVARACMGARKLLHVDGPYGLGFKAFGKADRQVGDPVSDEVTLRSGTLVPVPEIQSGFSLSIREIAAFEESGQPIDLSAVVRAVRACAAQEDSLVFHGSKSLGLQGLLNADGISSQKLQNWQELGMAADDVAKAVTILDHAGFTGSYALALAPERYNMLLRRYPNSDRTELEHLQLIAADVVKSPGLRKGGVLLAAQPAIAAILVGQDLQTSFIGPEGRDYEFAVSETVALRLTVPQAVCALQ